MSSPLLFDSALIRKRLARARRAGFADFLVARVVDDLSDRLDAVLREFPRALDLGTPVPAAAIWLARSGRAGAVTRLAPTPEPGSPSVAFAIGDPEAWPGAISEFLDAEVAFEP